MKNAPKKKGRQVISIMFTMNLKDIMSELDVDNFSKETWTILKVKGGRGSHFLKG